MAFTLSIQTRKHSSHNNGDMKTLLSLMVVEVVMMMKKLQRKVMKKLQQKLTENEEKEETPAKKRNFTFDVDLEDNLKVET